MFSKTLQRIVITVNSVFFFHTETGTGGNQKHMEKIRIQNNQLHEENNLLKVKMEILLDMVGVPLFCISSVVSYYRYVHLIIQILLHEYQGCHQTGKSGKIWKNEVVKEREGTFLFL